jgi:hypothetical protein
VIVDSALHGCDVASLDNWFPMVLRNVLPSFSKVLNSEVLWIRDPWEWRYEVPSIRGTDHPLMQRRILEERNPRVLRTDVIKEWKTLNVRPCDALFPNTRPYRHLHIPPNTRPYRHLYIPKHKAVQTSTYTPKHKAVKTSTYTHACNIADTHAARSFPPHYKFVWHISCDSCQTKIRLWTCHCLILLIPLQIDTEQHVLRTISCSITFGCWT